ncbi:putative secreted beta-glucosidase adg3 [Exophiala dermatitidis]
MRQRTLTSSASALLLLAASVIGAKHGGVHDHLEVLHKRHRAHRGLHSRSTAEDGDHGIEIRTVTETVTPTLEKRGGQCAFPTDAGLVAVTPNEQNAGWAMSPDQPCKPGNYCPYACPPGQVSMQWDPSATSYSYPKSMNGGLYCDEDGNIQKPFPDRPYCEETPNNIGVVNNAGSHVSFCQTVLPGNEAMLIPTLVGESANLAVPDTKYWCGTAAHYYINPPGVGPDEACVWGDKSKPVGNWSPYVAGANIDASGETFIKLGWNPIYLEPATPFRTEMPDWGVKIDCPDGNCNGLPCAIDPTKNNVNEMVGSASDGAGGGAFCVVTVPKGSAANFVVFTAGGDSSSGSGSGSSTSSTSNGGGAGTSSSAQGWKGGQFFQTSSAAPASSTESSTTSTTTSSESSSSPSSTTSAWTSSWSATSSSSVSTTSSAAAHTSSHWSHAPSPSAYFSLFNNSTTTSTEISSEGSSIEATATPTAPSKQPSIQPATGAASTNGFSFASILSGLGLYILFTL